MPNLTHPLKPSELITRPPVREHIYGWIRIKIFFLFGFRVSYGFHVFRRITTQPARPNKYNIKNKNKNPIPTPTASHSLLSLFYFQFLLSLSSVHVRPHHLSLPPSLLTLFLPPSRLDPRNHGHLSDWIFSTEHRNSDWISLSTESTQARSHQSSDISSDLEKISPNLVRSHQI